MKNKYNDKYYVAVIPARDTDADYIEYYISSKISDKEVKTDIYTVNLVDMSVDPLAGVDGGSSEGKVSITASSPTRWFNDIAVNDGYFAGYDLDNINFEDKLKNPHKNAEVWPDVNSKWNQPRAVGTNPHKGLDLDIAEGEFIVPMLDGVIYAKQDDGKSDDYIAVKYDLSGTDHANFADLVVYYIHINPDNDLKVNDSVTAGDTELGIVNSQNHLHISIRDFSNLDLPQYYFFKHLSEYDNGYKVDLMHGPEYSERTVKFKGYVYDESSDDPQPFESVYINYIDDDYRYRRALMTRSGNYYSYTFPSEFSGCPVAYYLEIYRSGLPYDMKGFSPAYYNIYNNGSQYVSTPPPWSAGYEYIVP